MTNKQTNRQANFVSCLTCSTHGGGVYICTTHLNHACVIFSCVLSCDIT